jgi:ketosteroid isomerase-like protein
MLTPFRAMVDAWLAPEPPAAAVAVAPGTSVGAGGQAAQIPASPPEEPVPPASKPEGVPNAPVAVAEVTAGNQQPGVARPAQDAKAREAGKNTLKPAAGSNKETTVVASSDEPADDAVEKPAHGSSAAGTSAAGTTTDEATPPQHAATDDAVQALVLRYIAAETSGNIEGLLSLYDDRVEFHQYKLAGHDYIRNYRQQFFEQWKKVETTLLGPIEINWSDTTTVNVTFVTSIHVVEPALDNPGETRNHLTLRVTNGGLKIVHEHQDVLKSPS